MERRDIDILMIGAGGTGGWALPLLFFSPEWWYIEDKNASYYIPKEKRVYIRNIYLYDPDVVEKRNLLRQNFGIIHLGVRKDVSFEIRYRQYEKLGIFPRVRALKRREDVEDVAKRVDVLILAVDSFKARREYLHLDAPLRIDAGNMTEFGQIFIGRTKLYTEAITHGHDQHVSCAMDDQNVWINATMALLINEAIYTKYALQKSIKYKMKRVEFKQLENAKILKNKEVFKEVQQQNTIATIDPIKAINRSIPMWVLNVAQRKYRSSYPYMSGSYITHTDAYPVARKYMIPDAGFQAELWTTPFSFAYPELASVTFNISSPNESARYPNVLGRGFRRLDKFSSSTIMYIHYQTWKEILEDPFWMFEYMKGGLYHIRQMPVDRQRLTD